MIKELLKEKEPIAYTILKNTLESGKLAHSYLFSGELNNLKIDAAYLLAQSIIENNNSFACEECETCQRIKNNEYFDVIYIDGYESSIKNEMVERIMDEFSKTALEKSGKKIYIISNVNNASNKALNSLLKFMEEPSNDNTYSIIITDRKEDLLPTIVSRCLEIPFMTRDFSHIVKQYEELGFSNLESNLLTNSFHMLINNISEERELFFNALELVYETIDSLDNKEYIPILYSQNIYNDYRNDDLKKITAYYLDIMIYMIEDCFSNKNKDDEEYNEKINILKNNNPIKLLEIFEEAKDKLLMNVERKLLFDSIAFSIISYT